MPATPLGRADNAHHAGRPAVSPVNAPLADAFIVTGDADLVYPAPAPDTLLHCASSGTPLRGGGHVLGALGVAHTEAAIADNLAALAPAADIVAAVLVRTQHAADAAAACEQAHTQTLRTTLLASVSHDLRTPLAVILGAAFSLVHQRTADVGGHPAAC